MRNWKELGVIPDSEEEDGFDSQSTASEETTLPSFGSKEIKSHSYSVWDVPLSQNEAAAPAAEPQLSTISAPQLASGGPWDVPLSQEEDELAQGQHAQARRETPPPIVTEPPSSPLSTLSSVSFVDLSRPSTLSPSFESRTNTTPRAQDTPRQALIDMTAPSPISTPSRIPALTTPVVSSELGERDSEYVARQTAMRYERSLRARKPIQQHPFLLEAAQYRTSMQSRGLKPLRIAAIESQGRRKDGETQEVAYEPESQDSHGADGSGSRETESQFLEDYDDWAIPSSSPPRPPRAPRLATSSSHASSLLETDDTSVQIDALAGPDELPALEDLLSHPIRPSNKYTPKRRQTSPRTSSKKKVQRRVLDSDDIAPSVRDTPAASPDPLLANGGFPSSSLESIPNFLEARTKSLARTTDATQERRSPSPATPAPVPEPMVIDSGSDTDIPTNQTLPGFAEESDGSEPASDGGERIVTTVGRSIRGVLPASWLRLDQQAGRDNIRKAVATRHANRPPEREQRRGVAKKRRGTTKTVLDDLRIWSDDSDIDEPTGQKPTTDEAFPRQARLVVNQASFAGGVVDAWPSDDEGAGSVMEDNRIDHMLVSRKRQMKLNEAFHGASKHQRAPSSSTTARSKEVPQQPRITDVLSASRRLPPSALQVPKKRRKTDKATKTRITSKSLGMRKLSNQQKPSALSILDVIEPNAPRFLKIAARTARKRPDQGRGSPSKKSIRLASREDHVDALSILYKWRSGSIQQRSSVTSSIQQQRVPRQAKPLSETSANQDLSRPGGMMRKTGSKQTTPRENSNGSPKITDSRSKIAWQVKHNGLRPAQLETRRSDPMDSRAFYSGKRILDRLFSKTRTAPSSVGLFDVSNDPDSADSNQHERHGPSNAHKQSIATQAKPSQKSRYRKQTIPVHENIELPQFVYAHDPLPCQRDEAFDVQPAGRQGDGVKMAGLGPYGTEYTHHFEIFPLPRGTYFHETSLIGSGILTSVVKSTLLVSDDTSRARASHFLGGHILRWGPWSEQVSSELGVLFDFIAEKLDVSNEEGEASMLMTTKAADFFLLYIKDHMSFEQVSDVKAFLTRFNMVLTGLNDKINVQLRTPNLSHAFGSAAMQRTYERILLAALCVVQMCRKESSLVNEQMQAEDMLKACATTAVAVLMQVGTSDLRQTYKALNSASVREKGLREEESTIHSWTVVMKVLDEARLLRGSFWDVVSMNLMARDYIKDYDADKHDILWQDLFSFLPLVEFDNKGLLESGSRHEALHEGWSVPQRLLRAVFQLYRENPRQSPSFNNYCRALVGRCYYLVREWGWRKSSSVIGVIFDFFGSQDLAHLRNEEVYRSPRFLEELAGGPKLEIEPDDRCFHVFLKLLALSIQLLREVEATKDIRNLVARTMPNHSRQYLKEKKLHQRDLAALRNHHDLLCTLFWACPPDLRPSATLIEGLVDPATSHKETCLISLRSWSQLARFVVSNGEASNAKAFGPLKSWRDSFFTSMLQQYRSIASEINQQFHSLGQEERQGVSEEIIKAMIFANKIAVQDVLHFSVTASYDVMHQCPDLEAAWWSLSTKQLQLVLDHFSVDPPELDWSILMVTLKTLDHFITKIDEFKDAEDSQQRESQILDSEEADDALQALDECVAKPYFSMSRCVMSDRGDGANLAAGNAMDKVACKELVIMLSARFASRLVKSNSMRLSQLFKYNKYGLFNGPTHELTLEQRRYLVLCVLTLLRSNMDFSEAGFSLMYVWMLAIVKPREGLCWENQLAEQLHMIGAEFIPDTAAALPVQPHYDTNKCMFEFAISHMRTTLRQAEPAHRAAQASEYAQTLKHVMQQMIADLKSISHIPHEHVPYVSFARRIISLIRSHGADICSVDSFFYQISKDYSPPAEDPQLQIAAMESYELRLDEAGARQRLFFFMFNNFKLALNKDELDRHTFLIYNGIKQPAIRGFVLSKLLPAALRAAWKLQHATPLADVCIDALDMLLTGNAVSTELTLDELAPTLATILAIKNGYQQVLPPLTTSLLHLLNRSVHLMNLMWPSLLVASVTQPDAPHFKAMQAAFKSFQYVFFTLELQFDAEEERGGHQGRNEEYFLRLFNTVRSPEAWEDEEVDNFTGTIMTDVRRDWVVREGRISIKMPANSGGTQSPTQATRGVLVPQRDEQQLFSQLRENLTIWLDSYETSLYKYPRTRKGVQRRFVLDELVF